IFFHEGPVENFEQAKASDQKRFKKYFHSMLDQGIFIPPSPFEAWFISTVHHEEEFAKTITAHENALESL
ncbi:MAG: hypothetical protein KDD52_03295, partial [Bdellovibrionales bacterium]|nr:hypothetical protein [Bdellovibrionales bacterium]